MLLLLLNLVSGCMTTKRKLCVFPFKYGGIIYYSCTDVAYHRYWCYTSNIKDGSYKEWGNCTHACTYGKLIKIIHVSYMMKFSLSVCLSLFVCLSGIGSKTMRTTMMKLFQVTQGVQGNVSD